MMNQRPLSLIALTLSALLILPSLSWAQNWNNGPQGNPQQQNRGWGQTVNPNNPNETRTNMILKRAALGAGLGALGGAVFRGDRTRGQSALRGSLIGGASGAALGWFSSRNWENQNQQRMGQNWQQPNWNNNNQWQGPPPQGNPNGGTPAWSNQYTNPYQPYYP